MPDSLVFLDTNILVYAYSANEPDKALIAKKLLATGSAVVSAQVLNELVSVMHRKLNLPVDVIDSALREILTHVETVSLTPETTLAALRLMKTHKFSWYDSLIIAAAQIAGCSLLFTEDLHHGFQIMTGPLIVNPFQDT